MFYLFFRFCSHKWEGSSLVLGTMYSYDIFAAVPCCTERLKVSQFIHTANTANPANPIRTQ